MPSEEENIQRLVAEKRHKEVIQQLAKIAQDSSASEILAELLLATNKQNEGLIELATQLKNMPTPEAPEIKLETKEVDLSKIDNLGAKIIENQSILIERVNTLIFVQSQPRKWRFDIEKELGPQGRIKGVTAEQLI